MQTAEYKKVSHKNLLNLNKKFLQKIQKFFLFYSSTDEK